MALPTDYVAHDPRSITAAANAANAAINFLLEGTGWRNLLGGAGLLNGWTATVFMIRKAGSRVDLIEQDLNGTAATGDTIFNLGSAWGVDLSSGPFFPIPTFIGNAPAAAPVRITTAGQLSCTGRVGGLRAVTSWPSNPTVPSSLPGV
ncbi:hypothetical protein J2Y69_002296 [Microbacterium resistens]|uniref:Uncharacterized protein n=1 Tax=Microbacterium resistens TaxID=156977 RepID=A0ABU1SDM7_9MICO|nr:hypothetical protein [Microbacterium resistens]MDR6867692.1 hypothetical protein [Microbacterium resistens]